MRVGVIGATGAVGKELVEVLAKRHFPVKEIGRASCRERVLDGV